MVQIISKGLVYNYPASVTVSEVQSGDNALLKLTEEGGLVAIFRSWDLISAEPPQTEIPVSQFDGVESIKKVKHEDADDLLAQGYEIHESYAKDVVLIKRAEKQEPDTRDTFEAAGCHNCTLTYKMPHGGLGCSVCQKKMPHGGLGCTRWIEDISGVDHNPKENTEKSPEES